MTELPDPADALPAADHHCRLATAHLEGRPARGSLLEALVALLEAAGGPDVGNVVRTHLERSSAAPPTALAGDRGRERVLVAARCLHRAAESELRAALRAAGLDAVAAGDAATRAADDAAERTARRERAAERAEFVERVLAERRAAVDAVLDRLAGGALPDGPAHWPEALTGGRADRSGRTVLSHPDAAPVVGRR